MIKLFINIFETVSATIRNKNYRGELPGLLSPLLKSYERESLK
jgi:hypothetical protein